MKKLLLLFILTLSALISSAWSQDHTTLTNEFKVLNVNNIKFRIGTDINKYQTGGAASWRLDSKSNTILYDHGMWLVGKVRDSVKAGIREWWYRYSYGPILDGKPASVSHPKDSAKYRVYKITEGDDNSNPDYADWPSEFGAPIDSNGNPKLFGDQTLWTVYNMFDTNYVTRRNDYYIKSSKEKLNYILPVEVRETVYAHTSITEQDDDLLSNIIFIEYEFINKGDVQIDSAYWGFWTDIDFDPFTDNNPLIDVERQLGLCYSVHDEAGIPAVGYTLLYGPTVDAQGSTAQIRDKQVQDKMNLDLNTFHPIDDDSWIMVEEFYDNSSRTLTEANLQGPPYSNKQVWNVARGNGAFNYPYYDSTKNAYTTFPFYGNPETKEGWYAYKNRPELGRGGGAGFVFFAGPFAMAPADTQWTMIALIPAAGEDSFDSITKLRNKVDQLRMMPYDSLAISSRIVSSVDEKDKLKLDYSLQQNYPNPFNPNTKIVYSIPKSEKVKIEIYNVLGEKLSTLFYGIQQAGKHSVEWNAHSYSSGIYFYRLTAGNFIETNKMMLVK